MGRAGIFRILSTIALLQPMSLAGSQASPTGGAQTDAREEALWAANVTPYLAKPLWQNTGRYDATHLLMVPMHAAFKLRNPEWQHQFFDHFSKFLLSSPPDTFSVGNELSWLQYDYLASQFLALAAASHAPIPPRLPDLLGRQIQAIWTVRPAGQWTRSQFSSMKEQLLWKLARRTVPKSYYRAITDHEQYVFTIAADLATYEKTTGTRHSWSSTVDDILSTAREAYTQRVEWQADGGWLFQPGVWTDHPDFLYAGQPQKVVGMKPAPLPDVAEDASHSLRRPLWIVSLLHAARDSKEAAYYARLLKGLEKQFYVHVLVPPTLDFPAYRTKNWMDGRNGVFRWNYQHRGPTWGYGPYELSGSFRLGWWAFLGSKRVSAAYADQARRYPLPPLVLSTYDPNSPAAALRNGPNRQREGFYELIARLASRL